MVGVGTVGEESLRHTATVGSSFGVSNTSLKTSACRMKTLKPRVGLTHSMNKVLTF